MVFSKADWRYAIGVGGDVGEKGADSTSSDQKWRMSLDQSLRVLVSTKILGTQGVRRTLRARAL